MLFKLFKDTKNALVKNILLLAISLIVISSSLFLIINSIASTSSINENVFSYAIKVRNSVEELDRILESAEINTNVLADAISNSYDSSKQLNEAYNMQYIKSIDGLIRAALGNSPGIDGSWFQINSDLPFAIHAYNWYGYRDDQFINLRDQFMSDPSSDRKITPENDPYYFNAVDKKKATWSDIYIDPDTKKSMITISNPIYKNNVLVGVVGIDISTDNLMDALNNMRLLLGDSELYLLNINNKVILTKQDDNSTKTKGYSIIEKLNSNKYQPLVYYDNFVKKIAIILTLSNKYKLIISFNYNSLMENIDNLYKIIYILFSLNVIFILILAFKTSFFKALKKSNNQTSIQNEEKPNEDENDSSNSNL